MPRYHLGFELSWPASYVNQPANSGLPLSETRKGASVENPPAQSTKPKQNGSRSSTKRLLKKRETRKRFERPSPIFTRNSLARSFRMPQSTLSSVGGWYTSIGKESLAKAQEAMPEL